MRLAAWLRPKFDSAYIDEVYPEISLSFHEDRAIFTMKTPDGERTIELDAVELAETMELLEADQAAGEEQ